MAKTLAVDLTLKLDLDYVDSDDLNANRGDFLHSVIDSLATGTASDQSDLMFYDHRTLAATSEDLDLAGSLTDVFGDTLTFVKIKGMFFHNKNTTSGHTLTVGGAAANAFVNWVADSSDKIVIGPNGVRLLWDPADGFTVTAGTGDLLKVDAGANTVVYDIILFGTSA